MRKQTVIILCVLAIAVFAGELVRSAVPSFTPLLLEASESEGHTQTEAAAAKPNALPVPSKGSIPVAFLLSDGAVMIDFAGPWEVFEGVYIPGRAEPFTLYTVAETNKPIRASGGMQIIPDYTIANAPAPKVIVIPAQSTRSPAVLEWIRKSSKNADVTMSVCTGAFLLARTGLLSGKSATTFHSAYQQFEADYPDIHLKRGARYVDNGNLATAGGLSSGIDLALHIVERYFGRHVAEQTAYQLEYQGQGWKDEGSNQIYAQQVPVSTTDHPLCPVCGMEVAKNDALKSLYKGKDYYSCSQDHKQIFDAAPEKYAKSDGKK